MSARALDCQRCSRQRRLDGVRLGPTTSEFEGERGRERVACPGGVDDLSDTMSGIVTAGAGTVGDAASAAQRHHDCRHGQRARNSGGQVFRGKGFGIHAVHERPGFGLVRKKKVDTVPWQGRQINGLAKGRGGLEQEPAAVPVGALDGRA